jgi:hypothetical protein
MFTLLHAVFRKALDSKPVATRAIDMEIWTMSGAGWTPVQLRRLHIVGGPRSDLGQHSKETCEL